jgi:FAT domain
MVSMQILAEMEEVVELKQSASKPTLEVEIIPSAKIGDQIGSPSYTSPRSTTIAGRNLEDTPRSKVPTISPEASAAKVTLIRKWRGRLQWAPKEVDVFRQILAVRTLVADPTEDLDSWLELVTLCRKENMFSLCENLLRQLGAPIPAKAAACTSLHSLSRDPQSNNNNRDSQALSLMAATGTSATIISGASSMPNLLTFTAAFSSHSMQHGKVNPRVVLATHKYWWCSGEKARALAGLTDYIASLESHASLMATAADKIKEGHGLGGKADIAVNLNLFSGVYSLSYILSSCRLKLRL